MTNREPKSAFDRLPVGYRDLCSRITLAWQRPKQARLSPQNRRVRFAADSLLAGQKSFPNSVTRQQERASTKPWKARGDRKRRQPPS